MSLSPHSRPRRPGDGVAGGLDDDQCLLSPSDGGVGEELEEFRFS